MILVVIDSNVYVSALVFGGSPAAILQLAEAGAFQIVVSETIKAEITETLTRKFGWSKERVEEAAGKLWDSAMFIAPVHAVEVSRDPDDDHILACALESRARIIVTGDKDLLTLHPFGNIEILSPAALLTRRPM